MEIPQGIVLPVLVAALIANVVILVLIVAVSRYGRRRGDRAAEHRAFAANVFSSSYDDSPGRDQVPPPAAATRNHPIDPPTTSTPEIPMSDTHPSHPEDDDVAGHAALATAPTAVAAVPDPIDPPVRLEIRPTPGGIDELTGLPDQAAFLHRVATEDTRLQRYHRPATVVIFELDGVDRLADRLGAEAVDRIVPALADTIRRLARDSDQVARLASGRFAVLLVETDEIAAINYVERVRRACELWLESGAIALRLAVGWAGTTGDPTLPDAMRLATDRMYAELRRPGRRLTEVAAAG